MHTNDEHLLVPRDGEVLTIIMNHPDVLNAVRWRRKL